MAYQILIDENIPLLAECLSNCAEVLKFRGRDLTRDAIIASRADALVVRSTTKVDGTLLNGTKISFVGTATSGIDHVDTQYLKDSGIHFAFAPGSNANSVAECVVYAMLKWADLSGIHLRGKVAGIIGYGNIGRLVAGYSGLLGMKVLVNDPPLFDSGFVFPDNIYYSTLDVIFRDSDVITNHVPLTLSGKYATYGLVDAGLLDGMKPGALLLHTSRGGVIDENALLNNVKNGKIFSAVDVWEGEPLYNLYLANLSILASPHVAGYSRDGKLRGAYAMASELGSFFNIKPDLTPLQHEMSSYKPIDRELFNNEKNLLEMLFGSRRLEDDTRKMINPPGGSPEELRVYFDKMRKEYPTRREIL